MFVSIKHCDGREEFLALDRIHSISPTAYGCNVWFNDQSHYELTTNPYNIVNAGRQASGLDAYSDPVETAKNIAEWERIRDMANHKL